MDKQETLSAIKSMIVATINDNHEKAEQLHSEIMHAKMRNLISPESEAPKTEYNESPEELETEA